MSENFATGEDILTAAETDTDPSDAQSLLAAVCIAGLSFVARSVKKQRTHVFPGGSPSKEVVRDAATLLCVLTKNETDGLSRSRHALGLVSRLHQARRTEGDSEADNEHVRKLEFCRRAIDATSVSDPLTTAIFQNVMGGTLRSLSRPSDAIASYYNSLDSLSNMDLFSSTHWMYEDAPFLKFDAKPGVAYKVKFRARLGIVRGLLAVSDVAGAQSAVKLLVEFAEGHKDRDLKLTGWALVTRARVQRAANDTRGFLSTEAELKALTDDTIEDGPLFRYWFTCVADNASHLKDYGRVEWATRQRLGARARRILKVDFDEETAESDDFRKLVERAYAVGSRLSLSNLGNGCYDIVKAQLYGGTLDNEPERRAEALRILDVVDYAWKDFSGNGAHSLRMMRGLVTLLDDESPLDEVTRELVSVNHQATNENTARRALVAAVRSGVVGSSVVRARLDELLGSVDPVRAAGEFAVVMGLSAEWWFRVNDAGGSSEQALDWESGERAALDAVTLLRPAGVSLDPELEATCWLGAALSLAGRGREIEQLERLLWSVRCVAELMVTVSTTADRTRLSNGFARVFDTGAALSVELGDHDAADVIMEAARRDRVGLILAELARNPDVDTAIRSSALAVSDSSAAIPTTTTTDGEDGDEDGGTPAASSTESRSAAILIDRQGAVSDAERVLGPLGALCDASALMSITAASILDRRSDLTGTTVVLQLFPQQTSQSSGEDREVSTVRVYRRLTWIEGGDDSAVEEHLDHFDPPKTLLATSAEDRRIFAWLPTFAQILPQPLLDLLARADRSSPVRLMIVPTGLFHVPFDALPLSGSGLRDEMLIDRAVVSVHGSLTSMLALMRTDTVPSIVPSIAVYDGERADGELKHVEAEFVSLNTHVPGVIRVRGAEELRERLRRDSDSEPIAMLAMGVHGSSDDHGWGQGKTMPDGSIVTAAQALGWKAPRLCVLASCHSPITTADGVELSGFPLALMLTGAATVIGGLYDIDDKATTVIMNRFWELYAGGTAPLIALHQAKVEWLHHNPDVRRTPRLWAGLVTYGAATQ